MNSLIEKMSTQLSKKSIDAFLSSLDDKSYGCKGQCSNFLNQLLYMSNILYF